jgi:hypothetical protein
VSEALFIALFEDRSRPIKQANPKVLDYISQTMAYYPNYHYFGHSRSILNQISFIKEDAF